MHVAVLIALFGTGFANGVAGFEPNSQHTIIGPDLTRQYTTRHYTDIGAIQIAPDTARKLARALLTQARVCAQPKQALIHSTTVPW